MDFFEDSFWERLNSGISSISGSLELLDSHIKSIRRSGKEKVKLRLSYLFLTQNGECTDTGLSKFQSLCKAMEVSSVEESKIIRECNEFISACHFPYSDERFMEEWMQRIVGDVGSNKVKQAEIIWDLLNLTDTVTEPSRSRHGLTLPGLVDYWKFDLENYAALKDIAETISAITRQKEYLRTVDRPYFQIARRLKELDRKISQLTNDAKLLIREVNIA